MSKEFNPYDAIDDVAPNDYSRRVEQEVVILPSEDEEEENDDDEEVDDDDFSQEPLSEEELEEIEREKEAEERREQARIRREANPVWQFVSGNWLVKEGVTESYRYLIMVAVLLFFSVVSIFVALKLDQDYARGEDHLQLLRERSFEFRKMRFEQTSHSAIIEELERRKIPLIESKEVKTKI